jgi:hypothetical protein
MNKLQRGIFYGCSYFLISLFLVACGGTTSPDEIAAASGNSPPAISGNPPTMVVESSPYAFTPSANDLDFDPLTFSINKSPAWANFDTKTGTLTGAPVVTDIGITSGIVISVSDGQANDSLPAFDLTVVSQGSGNIGVSNRLPNSYVWGSLDVGQPVYVDRSFTFTIIPDLHKGLQYLRTANDDKFVSAPDAISFTVDRAVTVLVAYDERVSVLPTWLQSWGATGMVWDTSDVSHDVYQKDFPAGSVVLGGNEMGFSMYNLAIAEQGVISGPGNSAPTIAGVPQMAVGQDVAYSFTPTANDADPQDVLSFTIDNQPSWASFDLDTGALTGTPSIIDVGMDFSDITISVSDGQATDSLAPFDIEVLDWANGSAMLTWVAPTKNEDDTELTDLAGYRVYYSQTLGSYPNPDVINDPFAVSHMVQNLSAGTWFFVVTAHDTSFNESDESNAASKTISPP